MTSWKKIKKMWFESYTKIKKAKYDGKYLFICYDCVSLSASNVKFFSKVVKGFELIRNTISEHEDHNWMLVHKSRLKLNRIKISKNVSWSLTK